MQRDIATVAQELRAGKFGNFDAAFNLWRGIVPIEFARALSYKESNYKPDAHAPTSSATGLFQVMKATLADYNRFNPPSQRKDAAGNPLVGQGVYDMDDLEDPNIASRVGLWHINRIAKDYAKNHPNTLAIDWNNPNFVELLALGFVSGWANDGDGVQFVIGKMEEGNVPVEKRTLENVMALGEELEFPSYFYDEKIKDHIRDISGLYFHQRGVEPKPPSSESMLSGKMIAAIAAGAAALGIGYYVTKGSA